MYNAFDYLNGEVKATKTERSEIRARFDSAKYYINNNNQLCTTIDHEEYPLSDGVIFVKEVQTEYHYDGTFNKLYIISGLSKDGIILTNITLPCHKLVHKLSSGELYPCDVRIKNKKSVNDLVEAIESTISNAKMTNKFDFVGLFKYQDHYCYINPHYNDQVIIDLPSSIKEYGCVYDTPSDLSKNNNLIFPFALIDDSVNTSLYITIAIIFFTAMSSIFSMAKIRYPFITYLYGPTTKSINAWAGSMANMFFAPQKEKLDAKMRSCQEIKRDLEHLGDTFYLVNATNSTFLPSGNYKVIDNLQQFINRPAFVREPSSIFPKSQNNQIGTTAVPIVKSNGSQYLNFSDESPVLPLHIDDNQPFFNPRYVVIDKYKAVNQQAIKDFLNYLTYRLNSPSQSLIQEIQERFEKWCTDITSTLSISHTPIAQKTLGILSELGTAFDIYVQSLDSIESNKAFKEILHNNMKEAIINIAKEKFALSQMQSIEFTFSESFSNGIQDGSIIMRDRKSFDYADVYADMGNGKNEPILIIRTEEVFKKVRNIRRSLGDNYFPQDYKVFLEMLRSHGFIYEDTSDSVTKPINLHNHIFIRGTALNLYTIIDYYTNALYVFDMDKVPHLEDEDYSIA